MAWTKTATYKTMMVMNVTIDYITKGVLGVASGAGSLSLLVVVPP